MSDEVFTKEWLQDGRIVCYRFVSTGSEAAETWLTEIVSLFRNWDTSKPLLLLIDHSEPDNSLSPEALRAARQASQTEPDVPGKTALLIDGTESTHNVKALVEHVLVGSRPRQLFDKTAEADAIAWLLQP
jgi:hypothetical protein